MTHSLPLIIPPRSGYRKAGTAAVVVASGGRFPAMLSRAMVSLAIVSGVVAFLAAAEIARAQSAAAGAQQEGIEAGVRVAQLLKDAQRKREAGQIPEALADLRAANALIKKAKGAGHPDVLPILDMAGTLLLENGQIAEAQTPLGKAVTMREEMIADGKKVPPVEMAAALAMLARVQMLAGSHAEALERLTKAVELFESAVGAGNESTLAALEQLANARFAMGDSEGGQAALGQVLDRRRKLGAAAKGDVLRTEAALAEARAWSGGAAVAIGPLTQAISDHERARLDKKPVPAALRRLAELQLELGDVDAARLSFDRALTIDLAALGDAHAQVIIDRLLLLRLDAATEAAESIAAAIDPLVAELQQLAGTGDALASAGLRAAADVWMAAQDFARASELYRQALELDTRLVGEGHADVAADEIGVGRCLLGTGDPAAALPLLEHAATLSTRIRGPRHADTLAVFVAAGDAAARAGDLAKARKHLQAVLEAGIPRRGDADEAVLSSLFDGVAALEERAGERDQAMETRFSLVDLRQRQFGEDHARVADVMVRLANARQAAGGHADAVALYERGLAIMEGVHAPDHPEVAAILAPLAVSYRALGANEQAEAVLARGLTIWEATVGPDHPVTIATLKPLALVRLALKKDEAALPLMERLLAAYDADPATPPMDRLKLLKKLAQIYESRGDGEIARRYLERALEIESALGKTVGMAASEGGEDVAVDTTKLKRLLTVDEQAEANLAKARSVAASLAAAQERLAKVDARAAAKGLSATHRDPDKDAAAEKQRSSETAATVIAAALGRHRAGQHDEAVGMLRAAIAAAEQSNLDAKSPQRAELADLLIALADMRSQSLELTESVKLMSRALAAAAGGVGDGHPTTLVAALRLAAALRAKGDAAGGEQLDDVVSKKIATAMSKATTQQMESIREALRGASAITLAAGDRAATSRYLDMLLQTQTDLDDRSLLYTLDTLAELLQPHAADPVAAAVRSRCLQLATRAAGSRPVLSGAVQHHLGLAEAQAGKLPAAAALLEKAAIADRQTLGPEHPRVAWHLLELANVRTAQGDSRSAASLVTEVQTIEFRANVATAGAVPDLCRLAAVHAERQEFEQAKKLLAAALAAQEKSADTRSLAMAEIAAASARLSISRGQVQRARELLAESAAIAEAGHGAGHPLAVAAMLRQARLAQVNQAATSVSASGLSRPGRETTKATEPKKAAAESGATFAEFLAKKNADRPSAGRRQSPDEGATRTAAVAGPRDEGTAGEEPSAAEPLPDGGDRGRRKKRGAGRKELDSLIAHVSSAEAPVDAGAALPQVGGDVAAEESAAQRPGRGVRGSADPAGAPQLSAPKTGVPALPAQPVAEQRPSPFVAASRSGLRQRTAIARQRASNRATDAQGKASATVEDLLLAAWSAHELGSRSEAIAACEEAVALAARESGESSRQVADVLDQFATIVIAQGDLARGRQLLERLGSTRWKLLGPADPQVADAAYRLACLLADCGEYERAMPLARRALEARIKTTATHPALAAEAIVLVGRIDLGLGDPTAAAARADEARRLLATADMTTLESIDGGAARLVARLGLQRLFMGVGDLQAATVEADRLVADLSGGRPVARGVIEEILLAAARAHRLVGDARAAVMLSGRLVSMARTSSSGAVFLSELALSRRLAGDARWEAAAVDSGRVLAANVRRLSPTATDAVSIEATAELAAAWLDGVGQESARLGRADELITAASIAAAALPPTHPVAVKTRRLAARLAAAKGDDAKALGILADASAAASRRGVRPVAADLQRTFLATAADPVAVEAVLRRTPRE